MKASRQNLKYLHALHASYLELSLNKKSAHVLPLYLRCAHKLWKIKQVKYYTQRSTPANRNACAEKKSFLPSEPLD